MTYNPEEPSFHILICMIQFWSVGEGGDPMAVPSDCMTLAEVEEVEIEESYTQLISRATLRFPRGTVIRKTMTKFSLEEAEEEREVEVGVDPLSGLVKTTRKSTSVAELSDFKVGQRVRIRLGYTTDPKVAEWAKTNNLRKNIFNDPDTRSKYLDAFHLPLERRAQRDMDVMFDGYVTKVSADYPIEIECEDFATVLRQITCPEKEYSKCSVNTLLAPKKDKAGKDISGRLGLLEGTGLALHSKTEAMDMSVGHCNLVPDKTLADAIVEWKRFGLYAFIAYENNKPVLQCARSYFDEQQDDSILAAVDPGGEPVEVRSDYHVAKDGLSTAIVYEGYVAIDAQGVSAEGNNGQFLHLTVCKNPDYKEGGTEEKYRVLNESKISKKAMKKGFRPLTKASNEKRNDLRMYAVVPYISKKIPVTRDELLDEAVKYMQGYNFNGLEGQLTLFGDLRLRTGQRIRLVDKRNPGKNGVYLVESVETTFGTSGFRQRIKLPYCLGRKNENKE